MGSPRAHGFGLALPQIHLVRASGGGGGGGDSVTYDLSAGIPTGLSARDGQTFTVADSFSNEDNYTDPSSGNRAGIWEDADGVVDPTANGGCDVKLTFAFDVNAQTGGTNQRAGPGLLDVLAGVDELAPYCVGNIADHNFDRLLPHRFGPEDAANGNATFVGGTNTHALSGDEIIYDGTTLHTIGFAWDDTAETFQAWYDDAVQLSALALVDADRDALRACRRLGFWYGLLPRADFSPIFRLRTLQYAPLGDLWT